MDNAMQSGSSLKNKNRPLISRILSIFVTLAGSFVFVYFTVTTLVKRVFETGPEAFPSVWQDWAILVAIVPVSFIIILSFLAFLKEVGLGSGLFARQNDKS